MRVVLATRNRRQAAGAAGDCSRRSRSKSCRSRSSPGRAVAGNRLTFVENAILKARHAAQRRAACPRSPTTPGWKSTRLHGAPGIYSARYAGERRRRRQHRSCWPSWQDVRRAAHGTLSLRIGLHALGTGSVAADLPGTWEGRMRAPRGAAALATTRFSSCRSTRYVAELPPAEKNLLSHRGQALRAWSRSWARCACAGTRRVQARSAASRSLRAPALVRAQMSLLRLQLARRAGVAPAGALCRGSAGGPRISTCRRRRAVRWSRFSSAAARPACSRRRNRAFARSVRARHLPLAPDIEVTLEANPGTIEHGRFSGYRAAGVKRVSLGAQSSTPRTADAWTHPRQRRHRARGRRAAPARASKISIWI